MKFSPAFSSQEIVNKSVNNSGGILKSSAGRKWSERQDSNLQKTPASSENSKGDTQRDSQTPVVLGRDLSQVVTAWVKLPAPLKAAILAIVNSAEGQT